MQTETVLRSPRATTELKLLFAQLDLQRLERQKADLLKGAEAWERSVPLPGLTRLQCIARAADRRLKAFLLDGDIEPLKLQIRNLESQLKPSPALVAPNVTAEMCAGQYDTMNFRAVTA